MAAVMEIDCGERRESAKTRKIMSLSIFRGYAKHHSGEKHVLETGLLGRRGRWDGVRIGRGMAMAWVVSGMGCGVAGAATLQIGAMRDAVLYEDAAGAVANGAGEFLVVGRTNQGGGSRRRSLLRFDVSTIPAGAVVTGVEVRLHAQTVTTTDVALGLHRMLTAWTSGGSNPGGNEATGVAAVVGDATWLHATVPGVLWAVPGGDHVVGASAVTMVTGAGGWVTWSGAGLVADVEMWRSDAGVDAGWMLRSDELTAQTAKRFESADNADAGLRPVLVVEFTVVPEVSVGLLGVAGGVVVLGRRRREKDE